MTESGVAHAGPIDFNSADQWEIVEQHNEWKAQTASQKSAGCRGYSRLQTGAGECTGPVAVCPPRMRDETADETRQRMDYIARSNKTKLPRQRVETEGPLRAEASKLAKLERRNNPVYAATDTVAGHVPDTAWGGEANPPGGWLPMSISLNAALGGQIGAYPVGYLATGFAAGAWVNEICVIQWPCSTTGSTTPSGGWSSEQDRRRAQQIVYGPSWKKHCHEFPGWSQEELTEKVLQILYGAPAAECEGPLGPKGTVRYGDGIIVTYTFTSNTEGYGSVYRPRDGFNEFIRLAEGGSQASELGTAGKEKPYNRGRGSKWDMCLITDETRKGPGQPKTRPVAKPGRAPAPVPGQGKFPK
ncbi:hypothetical protein [Nocardia sp. NPDC058114]|uniref:hypothetical protein n=1 Tax=Nocardia sp. NPDC058114 TaxID=3346346 RepID=UPI0036DC7FAD